MAADWFLRSCLMPPGRGRVIAKSFRERQDAGWKKPYRVIRLSRARNRGYGGPMTTDWCGKPDLLVD